jgi:uncharacterized protein YkwD
MYESKGIMKKKIISIIGCLIAIALLWRFLPVQQQTKQAIEQYVYNIPQSIKNFASSTLASKLSIQVNKLKTEASLPGPLNFTKNQIAGDSLSISGVIIYTNQNREQNGNLPPLKENAQLNKAAKAKLDDMFAQQYFEHENPQGLAPADLAKAAGYAYISIGENLASGNFKDDKDLVQAWMDSPGHRANILNSKFMEIGVAVGQGNFKGRKVWLAVQEFGKPKSSCPAIDTNLKTQIDSLQKEVDVDQANLEVKKSEMNSMDPKTQAEYDSYNQKVAEYNSLIKIYNNKVDLLKANVAQYNAEVNNYNTCAGL